MASCALSADVRPASSGNYSTISAPSRRALLGFAAASAGAAIIAVPTIAGSQTPRPWDAVLTRYTAAKRAVQAYEVSTYHPAKAHLKSFGEWPSLTIRHYARNGTWADHRIGLEQPVEGDWPFLGEEPARRRAAYQAHDEQLRGAERTIGYAAISARMDDLDSLESAARRALMAEPAPDGHALAHKLLIALEDCQDGELWDCDHAALLADAARLSVMS